MGVTSQDQPPSARRCVARQANPRMRQSAPMQRCRLGECHGACCLHGVWIDLAERDDLLAHAGLIAPHLPADLREPAAWFDGRQEADEFSSSGQVVHSTVLPDPLHYGGTACIFLRDDAKCALQVAGQAAGRHPWRFKPFYCVLHPLDLDEAGRITLDETAALLDEPGSCLRPAPHAIPLAETFAPELRYLLGEATYQQLLAALDPPPTSVLPPQQP
jgi:hypothetical protein